MRLIRKLTVREKKLLLLALIVIGGISLYKWGVGPLIDSYHDLTEQIRVEKHTLRENRMLLDVAEKYQEQLELNKADLASVYGAFFAKSEEQARLKLLNILDQQLEKSELKMQSKDLYLEEIDDIKLERVVARLALQGEMVQLIDLLSAFKQQEELLMIEELQLERIADSNSLLINLKLTAINKRGDSYDIKR